jgi:hypothetical protein
VAHRRADREPSGALRLTFAGRYLAWLVGLVALSAAPPHALAGVEGFGGWEGDTHAQGYGYAAGSMLLRTSDAFSVPVRATGSYLYYSFRDLPGEVRVRAPGVGITAGPRASGGWGTATLLLGGELRWERRSVAGNPFGASVARAGFLAQAEAELVWGKRMRPSILVSYAGSAEYVYSRVALRRQLSNLTWQGPTVWFAGVEAIAQGNSDTNALQGGGLVEINLVRAKLSISVRAGYKESDRSDPDPRRGGYAAGGLYHRF